MVQDSQHNQSHGNRFGGEISNTDLKAQLDLLRNSGSTITIPRGPIDLRQMDPDTFLAWVNNSAKYLDTTKPVPKRNVDITHAETLDAGRVRAMDKAGGKEQVKKIKEEKWDITRHAALSLRDVKEINEMRARLNSLGNAAFDAVTKVIHEKDKTVPLSTRYDAAEDAALAMRLLLLKDVDFEGKEELILEYNARMDAWGAGVGVAAYMMIKNGDAEIGTVICYQCDAL
jgi:hypothetical protein